MPARAAPPYRALVAGLEQAPLQRRQPPLRPRSNFAFQASQVLVEVVRSGTAHVEQIARRDHQDLG